eukprot:5939666-Lingulodinium_polyedra.AAC.1
MSWGRPRRLAWCARPGSRAWRAWWRMRRPTWACSSTTPATGSTRWRRSSPPSASTATSHAFRTLGVAWALGLIGPERSRAAGA